MTRITSDEDNQPKLSDNIEPVKSDDRVIKHMNDGRHHMGITLLTDDGPEAVDFNFLNITKSRVYTFPLSLKKAQSSNNVKIQAIKMRKFFCLLSKEKDPESVEYLDYETSFMISKSNKKLFVKKFKASDGANNFCQVRKEYKGKKTIKILSITKGKKVKHFPIYKDRVRGSKDIQEIHLIKDEENIRTFVGAAMRDKVKKSKSKELGEENHQINKEPILEEYYLTYDEFDKNTNSYIQMSQNKIQIFNKDKEVALSFRNCKIRNAQQVHQKFIYFSADRVFDSITVRDELADDEEERQDHYKEGFYVLNVQALLRGQIERYKVTRTTGGLCNLIEYNMYSERLSYQEDYNTITVIPLPHLNTVNFIGMGNKHDYLVWREKRGFFTALDRKGALSTWSTLSGKLLYTIPQAPHTDASEDALMDYDVYRADKGDVTYTRHFYQLDHSSVNLLRCSLPVDGYTPDKIHAIGKGVHEDNLRKQIQKHRERNDDNDGTFAGEKFDPLKYLFADSSDITILNSEIQFDLYHFKVMELKSFEDTGEISECKLKFHFTHRLIKHDRDSGVVRGDKDVTDKGPRTSLISISKNKDNAFEWDQSQDPMQRLYLSRDTKRLMEAVNNSFAIVYERFNINADGEIERPGDYYYEPEDHGQQIRWEAQYKITRWPSLLFQQTSVPYIFSPNFTYQLDFNYVDEQIVVLVTETQKVYMTFPADMMTTEYGDLSEYEAIDLIFSRMKWEPDEKERRIRVCTSNNLDCIFEIQATDEPDEKVEDRYLKLISVCKVDNLHTDVYRQDSPHFYHQPFSLDTKDVIERLLRMNQNYKIQSAHAMNQGLVTDIKDYQELVLDQINKIDYTQPWGDLQADFSVEKSYTWLDWLIIDQVIKDPIFELKDVTDEQSLQLSQIILPDGKGILHMLADFRDSKASHINGIALDLFAMTKKEAQAFLENVDEPVKFEIPMLMDVEKQTALDICLEVNRKEEEKSAFVHLAEFFMSPKQYLKSDASTDKKSSRNIMLAGIIFDSIKDSGLLHSSQNTMDAVIKAVKLGLPAVKGYLESRVMKVEHDLMPFSHPRLKSAVRRSCPAIKGEYGFTTAPIFGKVSDITDNLFKSNRPPQPTKIECLDLPELHENFHRGREFIESLTECKDLDFFTLKSVQIIIDHHHSFWYQYNIASQVVPALINVILFWGWNNLILPIRVRELEMRQKAADDDDIKKNDEVDEIIKQFNVGEFDMLVRVVSFIVTAYLMSNEFYIMTQNIYKFGTKDLAAYHFLQNLFFVGLTFNVLMSVYRAGDEQVMQSSFWSFQAWVSLSVWVRIMFQYLKEVRELSWTIGLIVNSVVSTGQFMIVFILSINAFSDSFNSISQSYKLRLFYEDKTELEDIDLTFRTNFEDWVNWWQITFKASLGDFPEEWGDLNYFHYHDWLIFFFAVFFLVILMLNLLIAIISEAQVIYTENKDQTTYRERALQVRTRFYSFLYPALVDAKKSTITPDFMYIVQQASAQRTLDEAEEKSIEEQVGDLDAKIDELTEMAHEAALKSKEEDKPGWWPPKPSSAGPEKLGGESLLSVNRPASKQRPGSKLQSKQPRDEELYKSIESLGYQSSSHDSDFTDDDRPVMTSPKQRRASILVKKNTKR